MDIHLPLVFQDKNSVDFKIAAIRTINLFQSSLIGAYLALSGCILQKILRNPLSDPFILGISAGGTCFAAAFVLLGFYSYAEFSFLDTFFPVQSLFSFLGCFISFALLLFLKNKIRSANDEYSLPLIGIVLNSLFSAVLILLIATGSPSQLSQIHGWIIGSLQPVTFSQMIFLLFISFIPLFFILKNANSLTALLFGDEFAKSLGVNSESIRRHMIFWVCVLISIVVSISGSIGFIGLIVPHFVKKCHRLSPTLECVVAMIVGASVLVLADMLSRTLFSPAQLPIGVFTAAFGAPALSLILLRKKYHV